MHPEFVARLAAIGLAAPRVVSEEETTPFPGIRVVERLTDEPNPILAIYVSLDEPGLKVDATEPTTSFVTVADWAERNGALVVDGEPIRCEDPLQRACFPDRGDMRARHPRTAMGLTEDRKTFILVVVDGRSPESRGMLGTELSALMHDLGAWVAINIDGGASSQIYVKGRGVINTPSAIPHRRC